MIPLILIILMSISGFIVARHAKLKGRNPVGWFIFGALVPVVSLGVVGLIKPWDQFYYKTITDNGQLQGDYENDTLNQKDIDDNSTSFDDYGTFSEDFEKIQSEYFKAERLKREAEADREKARLARQEAEQIRQKAFEEWEKIRKNLNASKDDMENPYNVLGVHENDSFDTIKEVYRKLVQIYHPDKHMRTNRLSIKQKNDLLSRINAAYDWIAEHHGKI